MMEHDPDLMLERLRQATEQAIQSNAIGIDEARRLMDHLKTSLCQTTYLQK
jgi:arginine decarboxylase